MKEKDQARVQEILDVITHVLEEHKVMDLDIISVAEKSTLTDYVVIGTGTSTRHLTALADYVIAALKERKFPVAVDGLDGDTQGIAALPTMWVVVDAYDVMVHLFMPEARALYRLEDMWLDLSNRDKRAGQSENDTSYVPGLTEADVEAFDNEDEEEIL